MFDFRKKELWEYVVFSLLFSYRSVCRCFRVAMLQRLYLRLNYALSLYYVCYWKCCSMLDLLEDDASGVLEAVLNQFSSWSWSA